MTEKDIKFLQLLAEEIKFHGYNAQAERLIQIVEKDSSRLDALVMPKIAGVIDEMIFANNMYWDEDVSFLSKTKRDYYNKSLTELKKKLSNFTA